MAKRMLELKPPNGGTGTIVVGYVGPLDGWLALVELLRAGDYTVGDEHVADDLPDTIHDTASRAV